MPTVDTMIKRAALKVAGWVVCWLVISFTLIVLAWAPFIRYGNIWLLLLLVIVVPIIHRLEKKLNEQIEAIKNALPEIAKEEMKRRMVYDDKVRKRHNKLRLILVLIMILAGIGIMLHGNYTLEKKRKASLQEMQRYIQLRHQQKTAPASKH